MSKKLVVLGSSSSEIFDYIFGDNENYYPYWASGWSARGLRGLHESGIKEYLHALMKDIPKDAVILLHFGNVDIDFTLPFKVKKECFYDFKSMVDEIAQGILDLRNFLADDMGFENIYPIFTAPPVRLHNDYWWREFKGEPAPSKSRGKMMLDIADKINKQTTVINCLPSLIESFENPICDERYTRIIPDHHIDFIQAQDVVYEYLSKIDGMLPRRAIRHEEFYPHTNYGIGDIKLTKQPRPRTVR